VGGNSPDGTAGDDVLVATFVAAVTSLDPRGAEFQRRVAEIESLADRDIRSVAAITARLAERMARDVGGLEDEDDATVAEQLKELRRTLDRLDFKRFEKTRGRIESMVGGLSDAERRLRQENAAIGQEQVALWTQVESLRRFASIAQQLDAGLQASVVTLEGSDAARAHTLRDEVLYPARRRHQEIASQLAVAMQGYAALDVVQENNAELIAALHAATTTTLAALHTAVAVAGVVSNRKVNAEQLASVNAVTGSAVAALDRVTTSRSRAVETMKRGLDDKTTVDR
jgi:uncharacterized protein YaaN involved in tellurite resistance